MKVRKYVIIQSRPTLETTQRPPLRKSHSYEKKYKIEKITFFLFSLRYKNDMKLPKRHSAGSHCCDSYLLLCTCAFHSVQCKELNILDKETVVFLTGCALYLFGIKQGSLKGNTAFSNSPREETNTSEYIHLVHIKLPN